MACSSDSTIIENTLAEDIANKSIEKGAVIACAASEVDTNSILAFFYPKNGATDIKYYESSSANIDENDFSNYIEVSLQREPVFNGYLEKFVTNSLNEKWIIITFELDNEIKISNPIRTKHLTKPSIWNSDVTIDQSESTMPKFIWVANSVGDNAIYFEVLSDSNNNLLSGTYTYENNFQYYNLANTVLNITTQEPPVLIPGNPYNFTLMDVSEDNWVNLVVERTFIAQ